MPRGDYAQDKGINWSTLKHIRPGHGSPRHYRYAVDNPDTGDTPSRMGLRLTHAMVLEPENVARDFIVSEMRRDVLARRLALAHGEQPEKVGTVEWLAWCRVHGHEAESVVESCTARRNTKAWRAIEEVGGIPMKPADIEMAGSLAGDMREALATVGKTIVSPAQHAEATAISGAVLAYPPAAAILGRATTRTEVRLSWTDEGTGLRCKGFADIICLWDTAAIFAECTPEEQAIARDRFGHMDGCWVVLDLKTCRDVLPERLIREAVRMGYHCQGAHYCDGSRHHTMLDGYDGPVFFGILGVEGASPHDVGLLILDQDGVMYSAERERAQMLDLVAECRASGRWPGKVSVPVIAEAPDYLLLDDDDSDNTDTPNV